MLKFILYPLPLGFKLAVLIIGFWLIPVEEGEDELQTTTSGIGMEEKEYKGDAGGSSKWTADLDSQNMTVMVYLMGSDLESQGGCASVDIDEMLEAELGDKVNVVIQTGGSTYWHNEQIAADSVQRFHIEDGELILKEDLGLISMVDKNTLADFIRWGKNNYPADRTMLILWNHGGGTMGGFGYDEHFEGVLSLGDLAEAMEASEAYFDIIGFDACLMATIETAYAFSPYADYLIASEETEPGTGWYYTEWLSLLGEDPGVNMAELSKKIVDDYIYGPDSSFWDNTTLTVMDTQKTREVYQALCAFMSESKEALKDYGYQALSTARSGAKSYGEGEFEQVDILDYVERTGLDEGEEIGKALEEMIVYHDANISNTNGIAMYFPYNYPDYYQNMLEELTRIGMEDEDYQGFFNDFISLMVYGQNQTEGSRSPIEQLTSYLELEETLDYSSSSWYQSQVEEQYVTTLEESLNGEELYLEEKGDGYVLQLSEEEWETVTAIELQVYVDDGDGYLELGSDNLYEFDEDGDLIVDFGYAWVALDGQIVPFYAIFEGEKADGSWYSYGYAPAELTRAYDGANMDIEVMIYWDEAHEEGYVTGYRIAGEDEVSLAERNTFTLEDGDELSFYCDYYTYEGEYENSYYFGDTLVVDGELAVSYEDLEEYPTDICYYLQDIYCNEYWTETIMISFAE